MLSFINFTGCRLSPPFGYINKTVSNFQSCIKRVQRFSSMFTMMRYWSGTGTMTKMAIWVTNLTHFLRITRNVPKISPLSCLRLFFPRPKCVTMTGAITSQESTQFVFFSIPDVCFFQLYFSHFVSCISQTAEIIWLKWIIWWWNAILPHNLQIDYNLQLLMQCPHKKASLQISFIAMASQTISWGQ